MPTRGVLVDQAQSRLAQALELGVDVVHRVGDVVHARAALGQVLADRRVGAERGQELDVPLADVQQRGVHALLLDRLAVGQGHAQGVAVEGERAVDVLHGYAHVVDPAEHRPLNIEPRAKRPGTGDSCYLLPVGSMQVLGRRGQAQVARDRALHRPYPVHDLVDRLALEHLVVQQGLGELVELARGGLR